MNKMKKNFQSKTLLSLLLIITSIYATYSFQSTASEKNSKDSSTENSQSHTQNTILVFGDSLSAAYNIKREEGWVSLLQDFIQQQQINAKVVNASISGETTSGGLTRLPEQLKRTQPDIVILELGGNDGLRGFDLAETRKNLNQMITLSKQHNAQVILTGIHLPPNFGKTFTQRFYQIYQELASQEDVTLIPFLLDNVGTEKQLMQKDGIHPNSEGQPIIMQTVWKYLDPLLNQSSLGYKETTPDKNKES